MCTDGVCCGSPTCGDLFVLRRRQQGRDLHAPGGRNQRRHACPDMGSASCGTNGTCDGAGECANYPSGTTCAAAGCIRDGHHGTGSRNAMAPESAGPARSRTAPRRPAPAPPAPRLHDAGRLRARIQLRGAAADARRRRRSAPVPDVTAARRCASAAHRPVKALRIGSFGHWGAWIRVEDVVGYRTHAGPSRAAVVLASPFGVPRMPTVREYEAALQRNPADTEAFVALRKTLPAGAEARSAGHAVRDARPGHRGQRQGRRALLSGRRAAPRPAGRLGGRRGRSGQRRRSRSRATSAPPRA